MNKKLCYHLISICASIILCSNQSNASHFSGGEVFYRYIGDSTGIPFQYEITVIFYRNNGGISILNLSQEICIKSSCYPNKRVDLQKLMYTGSDPRGGGNGGWPIEGVDDCADKSDLNYKEISRHIYQNTVILDGVCADWVFSVNASCCRDANDNITFSSSSNLYLEAVLNNTFGPNSSPQFVSPAAKAFCVKGPTQIPFEWHQTVHEIDGDSILYSFATPQEGRYCGPGVDLMYISPFTYNNPLPTLNGFNLDQKTGTFTFSPTQVGSYVIKVTVVEYRFDTSILQWIIVGSTERDLQIPITSSCPLSTVRGPVIDVSASGFSKETLSTDTVRDMLQAYGIPSIINNDSVFDFITGKYTIDIPVIDYECPDYDTVVTLKFRDEIYCSSISSDGSEFRMIGPDNIPRPIYSIDYICSTEGTTKSIYLNLYRPIDVNGDFLLYVKRGNDGNTLTNECGFELIDNFLMIVRSTGCKKLDYDFKNVTVVGDSVIKVEWEPDTNTFNRNLFGYWNILRANNDNSFYTIASLDDVSLREFVDTFANPYAVDHQIYQYAVQMYINGVFRKPTRDVHSILLSIDTIISDTSVSVYWNKYNGFEPDEEFYEVYLSDRTDHIDLVTLTWQKIVDLDSSQRSYKYNLPAASEENKGFYFLKVMSKNKANPNYPYESESNWIYFQIDYEKPFEIPTIPNVMTPNGDSQNDRFYIASDDYSNISISIYNRWGKLVFEDDNFVLRNNESDGWDGTDMNSGKKLTDGVYYYTIKFSDPLLISKSIDYQGHLTIMGNSNQ